jgi:hypothetical protein
MKINGKVVRIAPKLVLWQGDQEGEFIPVAALKPLNNGAYVEYSEYEKALEGRKKLERKLESIKRRNIRKHKGV